LVELTDWDFVAQTDKAELLQATETLLRWQELSETEKTQLKRRFPIDENGNILINCNTMVLKNEVEQYFPEIMDRAKHPEQWHLDAKMHTYINLAWDWIKLVVERYKQEGSLSHWPVGYAATGDAPSSLKDIQRQERFTQKYKSQLIERLSSVPGLALEPDLDFRIWLGPNLEFDLDNLAEIFRGIGMHLKGEVHIDSRIRITGNNVYIEGSILVGPVEIGNNTRVINSYLEGEVESIKDVTIVNAIIPAGRQVVAGINGLMPQERQLVSELKTLSNAVAVNLIEGLLTDTAQKGRFTSVAAVLCQSLKEGQIDFVTTALYHLARRHPILYSRLLHKMYITSFILRTQIAMLKVILEISNIEGMPSEIQSINEEEFIQALDKDIILANTVAAEPLEWYFKRFNEDSWAKWRLQKALAKRVSNNGEQLSAAGIIYSHNIEERWKITEASESHIRASVDFYAEGRLIGEGEVDLDGLAASSNTCYLKSHVQGQRLGEEFMARIYMRAYEISQILGLNTKFAHAYFTLSNTEEREADNASVKYWQWILEDRPEVAMVRRLGLRREELKGKAYLKGYYQRYNDRLLELDTLIANLRGDWKELFYRERLKTLGADELFDYIDWEEALMRKAEFDNRSRLAIYGQIYSRIKDAQLGAIILKEIGRMERALESEFVARLASSTDTILIGGGTGISVLVSIDRKYGLSSGRGGAKAITVYNDDGGSSKAIIEALAEHWKVAIPAAGDQMSLIISSLISDWKRDILNYRFNQEKTCQEGLFILRDGIKEKYRGEVGAEDIDRFIQGLLEYFEFVDREFIEKGILALPGNGHSVRNMLWLGVMVKTGAISREGV
ncbi:MAG: hypothetical protein HY350_03370, partial [Candidatus Omnitrophica bacterium]|nr:hypothetical protein [Candidatus Omnitrophota bacterium]